MFERKFRLPKGYFKSEKVLSSPFYSLKLAKNGMPFSRFGIVVSKKIDKRATTRNKIKRKFRTCIERTFGKIVGGYDFLFIFKKTPLDEDCWELVLSQFKKEKFIQ